MTTQIQKEILQDASISTAKFDASAKAPFAGNADTVTQGVPAGTVIYHAAATAPTGYLKANGAVVSRTTYAALFAAIGTLYGAGDGSTTFKLPDLRGQFLRGFDDGAGVDTGRVLGSSQDDAFQGHKHPVHSYNQSGSNGGSTAFATNTVAVSFGQHASALAQGATTDGTNGTPRTAAETRPKNIALLACIKF
jgi:microcystin-dependent protein